MCLTCMRISRITMRGNLILHFCDGVAVSFELADQRIQQDFPGLRPVLTR